MQNYNLPTLKPSAKPSDISPNEGTEKWHLDWCKFITHRWWMGDCMTNNNGRAFNGDEDIATQRAYGRGMQDIRKYKQILDKEIKSKDGTTKSLLNISWRLPQIYPTMRERVIERLLEAKFNPQVVAIDDPSIKRRNLAYLRDKIAVSPAGKQVMAATGMAPSNTTDIATILSEQDVDVLKTLGGYTLATEIALTEAIVASLDICKYHPSIARQMIEDLADVGFAHAHIKSNPMTKLQEIEYVDPAMAIIPRSEYDDCRDVTYGALMRPMTISALREDILKTNGSVDEAELLKIAKAYRPAMGNADLSFNTHNQIGNRSQFGSGKYDYDSFTVMVATCYFVAGETESFIAGIHDSGSRIYRKVPAGTQIKPESEAKGFKVDHVSKQNVHKATYVMGTDFCYGYGLDDNIVRKGLPGSMQAMIPIVTYRTNRRSLTESCMNAIDDLCIAVLKKRSIISKMPAPPNIQVNISALENVTQLGSMVLTPEDLLDIYTIRGILFTSDSEFTEFNQGTPQRPISELPNTTFDQLRTIQIAIEIAMKELMDIAGSNDIDTGGANPTNVLTATVNAYQASSNRALSYLFTANNSLQTDIHTHLARRYQSIAASGGATLRWIPVRTDTVHIVSLTPDIAFGEYLVVSKPNIDKESQAILLNAVNSYKQANGLNAADEMAVMNMILRGEYQKAQYYLAAAVAKKQQTDIAIAQENAASQAQAQGQAGVAVEQAKQQTATIEGEVKANLLRLEYSLKEQLMTKEAAVNPAPQNQPL